MPDLKGLTVIHWGWWLGVLKKKRLDPSHAFAMGIRADDVQRTYPLSGDDPKATAFLCGEVLRFPGADGWLLVSIDGHPLGWGKRVKNRIKSHVPNWLRFL
jgi:NOL1/NOP2/fmu family ribosome biogenesis protein